MLRTQTTKEYRKERDVYLLQDNGVVYGCRSISFHFSSVRSLLRCLLGYRVCLCVPRIPRLVYVSPIRANVCENPNVSYFVLPAPACVRA